MRLFILILIIITFQIKTFSQNNVLKKSGIETAFVYNNSPSIFLGYSKEFAKWPKNAGRSTLGFEYVLARNKYFMLTGLSSLNIYKIKTDFKFSMGLSGSMIPNFLYYKTDSLVDIGIRPEITIGYKYLNIGYQINYFLNEGRLNKMSRHSIIVYYRIGIWK